MKKRIPHSPDFQFNNEESNTSASPSFDAVLATRLSRRRLMLGAAGAAATTVFGGAGLVGCASTGTTGGVASAALPLRSLGFSAVAKSLADAVVVAPGYQVQVLYALGDPLTAATPAFKNDGTDTQFEQRAGDHHDLSLIHISEPTRPY